MFSNMKFTKIVLTGNYNEYMRYRRETGLTEREAIYAGSPEKIRGSRNVELVKYGTWASRSPEFIKNVQNEVAYANMDGTLYRHNMLLIYIKLKLLKVK